MMVARTLIKTRALSGGSPSEILADVNNQLCEGNNKDIFVTVWLGILDITTGKGVAANAGHEHPAIRRSGEAFELVSYQHSFVLGAMKGVRYKEHDFYLNPGDSLFVYTDGVPEAKNNGDEQFGTDRMLSALNRCGNANPQELIVSVWNGIQEFIAGEEQFDDTTMLCFTYNGTEK
jgi:sigma-B regulation protein RsbU (phosphoserine phosphatase)